MILITEKAEARLQKALSQARDKKTPLKCIKVRHPGAAIEDLPGLAQNIDEMLSDPDAMMFVCEDGDLFVLAQGVTARMTERITDKLTQEVRKAAPAASAAEAVTAFDLVGQWKALMDDVDAKAALIEARASAEKQDADKQQREKIRQAILDMHIEKELIQSLAKRRRERERIGVALVEDDAFTRNLVSGALKGEFEITSVGDGYNAVAKYPGRAPDILFLDIDLPDVSGLDVLKKILQMDPEAFVVMLSGHSQKENIMKAMELGAKGFVGKPFTKEKLLQYIQKCPRYKLVQPTGAKT